MVALDLDITLPRTLDGARKSAVRAERLGFDGAWSREQGSDAFLVLAAAALDTARLTLGTNVAVAFGRSPYSTAVASWQLQAATNGRLVLGLGSQVKSHVMHRYSAQFAPAGPRLREYLLAVRAVWGAFQTGRIEFHGTYYSFESNVFTPYFRPEEQPTPPLPLPLIMLAAVGQYNCRTVGLHADGIMLHPLHTVRQLQTQTIVEVGEGLRESGRDRSAVKYVCPVLTAIGRDDAELAAARQRVRGMIAFYGATRTYARVLEAAGRPDLPLALHEANAARDLDGATNLVDDELLDEVAISGYPYEVGRRMVERYAGVVDRVYVSNPESSPCLREEATLTELIRGFRDAQAAAPSGIHRQSP